VPATTMLCLDWWSYEAVILLAGMSKHLHSPCAACKPSIAFPDGPATTKVDELSLCHYIVLTSSMCGP